MDLPNKLTILYAMRLPKPVLMNPRARKNASAINHGISLENAENAAENGNNPVVMLTPSPIIATAPSGSGFVMIPTIVATKTASKFHACVVTPAGAGMRYRINPDKIEYPSGLSFAPFQFASASDPARTTGAFGVPLDRVFVVVPRSRFARVDAATRVVATAIASSFSRFSRAPFASPARGAIRAPRRVVARCRRIAVAFVGVRVVARACAAHPAATARDMSFVRSLASVSARRGAEATRASRGLSRSLRAFTLTDDRRASCAQTVRRLRCDRDSVRCAIKTRAASRVARRETARREGRAIVVDVRVVGEGIVERG